MVPHILKKNFFSSSNLKSAIIGHHILKCPPNWSQGSFSLTSSGKKCTLSHAPTILKAKMKIHFVSSFFFKKKKKKNFVLGLAFDKCEVRHPNDKCEVRHPNLHLWTSEPGLAISTFSMFPINFHTLNMNSLQKAYKCKCEV